MSEQANPGEVNMKIDASRAKSLVEALQSVQSRVAKASAGRNVRHVTPLFIISTLDSLPRTRIYRRR